NVGDPGGGIVHPEGDGGGAAIDAESGDELDAFGEEPELVAHGDRRAVGIESEEPVQVRAMAASEVDDFMDDGEIAIVDGDERRSAAHRPEEGMTGIVADGSGGAGAGI